MVDDIIDTAGTACKAADVLKENGASKVMMCACHGIFSKDAIKKIHNSSFDKVSVTNTVLWKDKLDKLLENNYIKSSDNKIDIMDISKLASLAIERCLLGNSLSELFNIKI
jgi:ribose-phosphate pyrophosphokinase